MIQGGGEMGSKITEDEVQRALDFCVNLFHPTTPEQHEAVRKKLNDLHMNGPGPPDDDLPFLEKAASGSESWMDVRAPIVSPSNLAQMLRTRLRSLSTSSSVSAPSSLSSPSSSSSVPPSPTVVNSNGLGLDRVKEETAAAAGQEESEMKMVLEKVNARRVIHADHMEGLNSLEQEDVEGFTVRLVQGQLGLVKV